MLSALLPFDCMRTLLQKLLRRPVLYLAEKFASNPDAARIYDALTQLRKEIREDPGKKGVVLNADNGEHRFIVFSDQHKGAKNGADDFARAEINYLAALDYYDGLGFHYIALGDCEELWENSLEEVKKHNKPSFEREKKFIDRNAFIKIFGNHDLYWDNDPFAGFELKRIYGQKIPIYEGVIIKTEVNNKPFEIFLTHGHQGDKVSDGNALSKFFIARIWAPLQSYLRINPNTPAYDDHLKTAHNKIMYEWSARQPDLILITGHTHQPVFESLTFLERLFRSLGQATLDKNTKLIEQLQQQINIHHWPGNLVPDFKGFQPSYFNSGCCCFNDGDITGLEIENGLIRLVKWKNENDNRKRVVLEEIALDRCLMQPPEC